MLLSCKQMRHLGGIFCVCEFFFSADIFIKLSRTVRQIICDKHCGVWTRSYYNNSGRRQTFIVFNIAQCIEVSALD